MNETVFLTQQAVSDQESAECSGGGDGRDAALAQEWLVELMARTWLEPTLADRYRADARSVLDEFGFTLAVGEQAPPLPESPVSELSIEELNRPVNAHQSGCFCLQMDSVSTSAASRTILR
ncbi:TIGR04351 family putative TOMM peptide [Streptomyces yaizuensis]|uniref:TIGR04351 family putative TOMM peptide n=1 Tax=Streptomyces yaizuensis TaxID=2989713 RepID=A0ABQ5NZ39_9ACTN|nr:TIGR04351 family putative TOMM peptide [Streptomyces sp. YSPA8]GLF95627.1 TIGR04351 family putative TOMM peptide [Streptomyces sp. YSPA8]